MSIENKDTKASTELTTNRAATSMISFDEFDHFFDDFLARQFGTEKEVPKVDIINYADRIEVQAALPGINKNTLDVSINNQEITIRATTEEKKEEEERYFRKEIMHGEFQRTLSLPDHVDGENATAVFKDGILTIAMPKTKKNKRKNIEIT